LLPRGSRCQATRRSRKPETLDWRYFGRIADRSHTRGLDAVSGIRPPGLDLPSAAKCSPSRAGRRATDVAVAELARAANLDAAEWWRRLEYDEDAPWVARARGGSLTSPSAMTISNAPCSTETTAETRSRCRLSDRSSTQPARGLQAAGERLRPTHRSRRATNRAATRSAVYALEQSSLVGRLSSPPKRRYLTRVALKTG
jgi:hypothetical protein